MVIKKATSSSGTGVAAISAAAQKIRDTLDKDKSTGWREKVQKWADGKKKLEVLLNDTQLSQDKVEVWTTWARAEVEPLFSKATAPFFITFFNLFLQYLFTEIVHPAVRSMAKTKGSIIGSSDHDESPRQLVRAIEIAGTVLDGLLSVMGSTCTTAHKNTLYTEPWLGLLVKLLEDCIQSDIGAWSTQATICEILLEIVAVRKSVPVKLLVKDDILGFKRLGAILHKTTSTSTLVPLINIALLILPNHQAKKEVRETALKQLFVNIGWDKDVTKQAFVSFAKITLPPQEDEIMACVGAFAGDPKRQLPCGYQVTALSIDGADRLDSERSKKYAAKGRVILYVDKRELSFKLPGEEGEETESFEIAKVVSADQTPSREDEFTMSYRRSAMEGMVMSVAFTVRSGQGQGLQTMLSKIVAGMKGLRQPYDVPHTDEVQDRDLPYTLEEVVEEVNTLAQRQKQEEATRDYSKSQARDTELTHGSPKDSDEHHLSEDVSLQNAGFRVGARLPLALADSSNVTSRSERKTGREPQQAEGNDGTAGAGSESEVEMPPASQQLPMHEEKATSRSKKRFGKQKGRASLSPIKPSHRDTGDLSSDEFSKPLPLTPVKSSRASASREVKATTTLKETVTDAFKPPAAKSHPPTLGSQIRDGRAKSIRTTRYLPENPIEAVENARRRGGSVAPNHQSNNPSQPLLPTPDTRSGAHQALAETRSINTDSQEGDRSPLPWSVEAQKTASTSRPKQSTAAMYIEAAPIDVLASKKAAAGVMGGKQRSSASQDTPAPREEQDGILRNPSMVESRAQVPALAISDNAISVGGPTAELGSSVPFKPRESSPIVRSRLAVPPQTAFKVPRRRPDDLDNGVSCSAGGKSPLPPENKDMGHSPESKTDAPPSPVDTQSSAPAAETRRVKGQGVSKLEIGKGASLTQGFNYEPSSEAPSSTPPAMQPIKSTLLSKGRSVTATFDMPSSSQPEIQPINLGDTSSLSEYSGEVLQHIASERTSMPHARVSAGGHITVPEEDGLKVAKATASLHSESTDGDLNELKDVLRTSRSTKDAPIESAAEEEPSTESSKKPKRSSMRGREPVDENGGEHRPRKHARLSVPGGKAEEEEDHEDHGPTKRARRSHSSAAAGEANVETLRHSKSKSSDRKRSKSAEEEQEEGGELQDRSKEEKKARRSMSNNKEKEKVLSDSQKTAKEVSLVLDQIAELLKERSTRRIERSSKESRLTRAQFGQIAKKAVEGMHKESVSLLKDVNAQHSACMEGYKSFKNKTVDPTIAGFSKDCKTFEGLIDASKRGVASGTEGRVLFE
ncbi:hypothetical protein I316_05787 [Kwoniella heveanensis BCC8398]|uniref:Uncharacterized protein n=1 Tax=Kwoniella heveanensis BCC8398 TaxID=1296120 RepID=A0A1B9GNM2_9TREE|nr:hypothetical protein I316_05787 [Kwoniella heveanensis BCC8398]